MTVKCRTAYMRFACPETTARIQTHTHTHTHSHTQFNTALPQEQWLRERASFLRYPYTACIVYRIDILGPKIPIECTETR